MRWPLLTLVLLAGLTFGLGLGQQAITDADEAYYAEAAREMVASGDWLTPHFNFSDRWQKPVLYYWLTAALYAAVGPSEWAARAWSALAGLGLVVLTWRVARPVDSSRSATGPGGRLPAVDRSAWLAGAIVATSFGYFAEARLALPDLALAFCVTGTIASVFRAVDTGRLGLWVVAGALAGSGFLLKGPVAVVVPAVVLLPAWWFERAHATVSWSGVGVALATWAAVGLPWYVAMTATHGTAYLESFFLTDNLERFATSRFNEPRPFWNYLAVLAGGMMPWTLFALGPLLVGARRLVQRSFYLSPAERRLWLWAMAPLVLFTASVGQQPRYILPVLPPLAVLLAAAVSRQVEHKPSALRLPAVGLSLLLLVLAASLVRLRPMLITVHPVAPWLGAAALVAAALGLASCLGRERLPRVPVATVLASVVLLLTVQFGALAGRRPEPVEVMADAVRAQRLGGERVGSYRAFVRNLVFYTGLQQEDLFDQQSAVRFLRSPERVLLVTTVRELAQLQRASGIATRELARVSYLNTANLRLDALVHPTPAAQLDTVLLVANK